MLLSDIQRKIIRYGAIALGIILIVVFASQLSPWRQEYENSLADADQRVVKLQQDLTTQNALLESEKNARGNTAETEHTWYDMGEAGSILAAVQTDMIRSVNEGGMSAEQVDWLNPTAHKLKVYEQIGTDLQQYLDPEDMIQWFDPTDSGYDAVAKWKCVSGFKYSYQPFDVLWLCEYKDQILAVAFAKYDIATGHFYDVSVELTEIGKVYGRGPDSGGNEDPVVPDVGGQENEVVPTEPESGNEVPTETSGGFKPPVVNGVNGEDGTSSEEVSEETEAEGNEG